VYTFDFAILNSYKVGENIYTLAFILKKNWL